MYAQASHRKLLWVVFVAVVIVILAPLLLAAPPTTPAPIGTWTGTTEDGRTVTLVLTPDGGVSLDGTTGTPVIGVWTWEPLPGSTGILRCDPPDAPAHRTTVYNVSCRGAHQIELSNYYFRAVLVRMM